MRRPTPGVWMCGRSLILDSINVQTAPVRELPCFSTTLGTSGRAETMSNPGEREYQVPQGWRVSSRALVASQHSSACFLYFSASSSSLAGLVDGWRTCCYSMPPLRYSGWLERASEPVSERHTDEKRGKSARGDDERERGRN